MKSVYRWFGVDAPSWKIAKAFREAAIEEEALEGALGGKRGGPRFDFLKLRGSSAVDDTKVEVFNVEQPCPGGGHALRLQAKAP